MIDDLQDLAEILNESPMFQEMARLIIAEEAKKPYRKFFDYYPEEGALRRELYVKHMEFFKASADHTEIALIAANRSGKSLALGYAVTCHLTGNYPDWWIGRKFDEGITCWMAGEDAKTVRDSMQEILFGKPGMLGTGLIPLENIEGKPAPRAGVPDGIDSALIRHKSGGISRIVLKAYDQGRESFQAAKVDVLGLDEEPPEDIYAEGLTRTMSTDPTKPNGLVLSAFTPLKGISKVVLMYLPGGKTGPIAPSRHVVTIGWNEVPHLSDKAKAAILDAYPLHQRDARSRGVPQLGSGAIYPVDEADLLVEPFELPGWYRCVYALDVGWNRTAALWAALDPETDVLYIYSEHYMGQEVPSVHAASIQARGKWIPGVIDPAARGRSQHDGQRLFDAYVALGLNNLTLADNAVEAGIHTVYQRMASGRLKVFSTCQNFLAELRVYRRDEKGKVVKENDHLLDDCRYICVSGIQRARARPPETWDIKKKSGHSFEYNPMASAWGSGPI